MRYIYCHPIFDERKCAHRFSYELSCYFDSMKCKLERFDYIGTGEAAGEFENVDLNSLRGDIEGQIGEDKVCLIGLRLGANLALDYGLRYPSCIGRLVLLAPIVNGADYVKYLLRKQHIKDMMTGNVRQDELCCDNFYNIGGFKTSRKFIEQIKAFDLLALTNSCQPLCNVAIMQIGQGLSIAPEIKQLSCLIGIESDSACVVPIDMSPFWERIPMTDYQPLLSAIGCFCDADNRSF